MCLILPWQVFYLAASFYPKSGHNSLIYAPGTVMENLSVVFLKGRKSQDLNTQAALMIILGGKGRCMGDTGQFPKSLLFSQNVCRGISLRAAENEHISKYQR